jgi:hypothetical protein
MIKGLSNQFLIDAYRQALALKLDSYFIFLLEKELQKRKLVFMQHEISERQGSI